MDSLLFAGNFVQLIALNPIKSSTRKTINMVLIADSGSTKTDWKLVDEGRNIIRTAHTIGLNPYFLTEKEIIETLRTEVARKVGLVNKVIFYGAGCGMPVKAEQVKSAISAAISSRFPPEVYGDMLGAARSLLQNKPGIACIIGTGANSCVYDGVNIVANVPSLGYILADWGSGTVLCKDLISLILQEKMSDEIRKDFYNTYRLDRREILDRIYNEPMANTFLASFTPFLLKHAEDPSCKDIILNNFRKFFEYFVLRYPQYKPEIKVSFVGSIAHHFKEFLEIAATESDISLGEIVKNPMEGLVKYHCQTVPASR